MTKRIEHDPTHATQIPPNTKTVAFSRPTVIEVLGHAGRVLYKLDVGENTAVPLSNDARTVRAQTSGQFIFGS